MSRRYRHQHRYESYWPAYVPVAERRAKAERTMEKLRKSGEAVRPVTIEGRTIARTFWGKGWCDHLETFGDYSNRLPRGRSYVRNGSVCHLGIERGRVEARVAGSNLYRVNVTIAPLSRNKWEAIRSRCAGRIGSLIELLQGKLSDEIMGAVTDRETGLFPLPGEIKYTCDCPDWADMCKHVSAVMYGVGARLDEQPELLFLLRGVDHNDLVSGETAVAAALAGDGSRRSRRRALAGKDLATVFGVELEGEPTSDTGTAATAAAECAPRKPARRAKPVAKPEPFEATGAAIARVRKQLDMSIAEFARAAGVSAASVTNWERHAGALRLHAASLAGLQRLHNQAAKGRG